MSAEVDCKKTGNTATVAVLILLTACAFLFRSWFASDILPPPDRMQGETTQSYRYARIISEGGSIPRTDHGVMHPQGMTTGENSIFEEYIAGWGHRIVGGDFDAFMRFISMFFPLLAIPGLYLWMRSTGFKQRAAFTGAAAYGILLPALLRTRGESFYRETVALPILVWLGWSVDLALTSNRKTHAIAAGLLLFASLAAWKVTGFISAFLFLFLLFRSCRRNSVPAFLVATLVSAQILASLVLSHLRHDTAILSPGSIMALFLALSIVMKRKTLLPWIGLGTAVLAGFIGSASTGHVGAVVLAKLRFLFSHPDNPALLSPDARLFWVSGYTSPSFAEILLLFGIPAAIAAFGLKYFRNTCRGTLLAWFLPLSIAGYLFFDRLHVFLALAIVVPVAALARNWWMVPVCIAVLGLQTVLVTPIAELLNRAGLEFRNRGSLLSDTELDSLLEWAADSTADEEVFMSFWHISGLISAYTDRQVVTHTFFENIDNRRSIIEFAVRTFQPEDSLAAFMRSRDADLFVYQADFLFDMSGQGLLYLAGLTEIPRNCAAVRMHYTPETLDSFGLVFQGPSLRVFRLNGIPRVFPTQPLFHLRFYRLFREYNDAISALKYPSETAWNLAWTGREISDPDMISAALLLTSGANTPVEDVTGILQELATMYFQGMYCMEYLAEDFLVYLHYYGPDPVARLDLARLLAAEGMFDEAVTQYRLVLEEDPSGISAAVELEQLLTEGNVE